MVNQPLARLRLHGWNRWSSAELPGGAAAGSALKEE